MASFTASHLDGEPLRQSQSLPERFWEDVEWLNTNVLERLSVLTPSGGHSHSHSDGAIATPVPEETLRIIGGRLVDFNNAGGLAAEMNRVQLDLSDGRTVSLVYKHIAAARQQQSATLGQPRECIFYETFASVLSGYGVSIVKPVWTYGSMTTGVKEMLLEDLSDCIQAGLFFGNHSPLNWGKDLPVLIAPATSQSSRSPLEWMEFITSRAFLEAARIHRRFWKDSALLLQPDKGWLRGNGWYRGEGQASWQASHDTTSRMWTACKGQKMGSPGYRVTWRPDVVAIVDASMAKVSWETFQAQVKEGSGDSLSHWTLVHGDFHPANMLYRCPVTGDAGDDHDHDGTLFLLDWEVVGVGNGAQDLAQFMISHVPPEARKGFETRALRAYYDELTTTGGSFGSSEGLGLGESYSWEQCQRDYVSGGIGRWMWMLPLLTSLCPDKMVQYFHDQVAAFIDDHGITVENVPMPRV